MIEKPEELFVGYVAQKAIIENDGKILFVKGNSQDAKWDLPGGRIHLDEQPEEGLLRELKEELNVDCTIGEIVAVKRFIHDSLPTPFYFVAFNVKLNEPPEKIVIPDDELSASTWLSREEINTGAVYHNCAEAIEKYHSFKRS